MEERLSVLKSTFGEIVDLKESNINILHTLDTRIKHLKNIYNDFITTNREQLFVFTLDSFHFQSKLVDLEYEDMKRMFLSITNRMYCDYYKLFKIVVEYIHKNIPDKKLAEIIRVHDNFPIYKDLEPFKQYDFQLIQSVHEVLLVILTYLHTYITNKEHDLKVYQSKNQIGLNIDSFVNTFSFNTIVMNQKALLFINYMEFFHKSHTKYLKRFTMKVNLMLSQLNNDIKFDYAHETKTTKKEMIDDLKGHNLDKRLLKELKVSISDDSSVITRSKSDSVSTPEGDRATASPVITHSISLDALIDPHMSQSQDAISDITEDHDNQSPRFVRSKSADKLAELNFPALSALRFLDPIIECSSDSSVGFTEVFLPEPQVPQVPPVPYEHLGPNTHSIEEPVHIKEVNESVSV